MKDILQWTFVIIVALLFSIAGWFAANVVIGWYNSLGGISLNKDILGIRIGFLITTFLIGFIVGANLLDRFNRKF